MAREAAYLFTQLALHSVIKLKLRAAMIQFEYDC